MRQLLPILCFLLCTAAGLFDKMRRQRKAKIYAAALEIAQEIRYLLQTGCFDTLQILSLCAKTKSGEQLDCLQATLTAVLDGADLYETWETNLSAYCKKHRITQQEAVSLQQLVRLLGSMDYEKQCAAYEGVIQKLRTQKELSEQNQRVIGNASVKIGLLCGLGLGILLWQV